MIASHTGFVSSTARCPVLWRRSCPECPPSSSESRDVREPSDRSAVRQIHGAQRQHVHARLRWHRPRRRGGRPLRQSSATATTNASNRPDAVAGAHTSTPASPTNPAGDPPILVVINVHGGAAGNCARRTASRQSVFRIANSACPLYATLTHVSAPAAAPANGRAIVEESAVERGRGQRAAMDSLTPLAHQPFALPQLFHGCDVQG